MTTYNFNEVISRKNTDCAKWDAVNAVFGEKDLLPMWVADMDLPIAKPITEALKKRIEHEYYGYPLPMSASVQEAIVQRMKQKFDWDIRPEWIVATPGVVPALFTSVKAFTNPGDAVIIQDPVYYPFWSAIEANGCRVANNPLKLLGEQYEIDFEDLENQFKPIMRMGPMSPKVRMMILCSPHNPVGRVWTESELTRLGELMVKKDVLVIADEIHCELLFKGHRHVPFAKISESFAQNSITCIAPSKTFNLAGLEASILIIPNPKLRKQFEESRKGFLPSVNILGMVAMEAAFRYGDEWLEQFLSHMQSNYDFLEEYFRKYIPQIKVIRPEGTYLVWLDCRELGLSPKELERFMNHKAKVGLDHGYAFGPSGEGFERINIACPKPLLEDGLKRIKKAVSEL